jgi:peptidoglycan/LPS O-acetylase OafA/YrhL
MLGMSGISVALFTAEMRFPGWLALLPVAGTVAVILAGPEATVNRIVFSNRAVVFVGATPMSEARLSPQGKSR